MLIRAESRPSGFSRPGILVTGAYRKRPPYRVVRATGAPDWILSYTEGGRGMYRSGAGCREAVAGDLVLLEPGIPHDYGCERGSWAFLWAHFIPPPEWIPDLRAWPEAWRGLRHVRLPAGAPRLRVRAAFLRCHADACAGEEAFAHELAAVALREIVLFGTRASPRAGSGAPLSPGIQRALSHLALRLGDPHSVASLARVAGLSPSRFSHAFKRETLESPAAYALKLRLQRAARLLAFTGRSVKEIAREAGFVCPFHFSRVFKARFGESPRAWRRAP